MHHRHRSAWEFFGVLVISSAVKYLLATLLPVFGNLMQLVWILQTRLYPCLKEHSHSAHDPVLGWEYQRPIPLNVGFHNAPYSRIANATTSLYCLAMLNCQSLWSPVSLKSMWSTAGVPMADGHRHQIELQNSSSQARNLFQQLYLENRPSIQLQNSSS